MMKQMDQVSVAPEEVDIKKEIEKQEKHKEEAGITGVTH